MIMHIFTQLLFIIRLVRSCYLFCRLFLQKLTKPCNCSKNSATYLQNKWFKVFSSFDFYRSKMMPLWSDRNISTIIGWIAVTFGPRIHPTKDFPAASAELLSTLFPNDKLMNAG